MYLSLRNLLVVTFLSTSLGHYSNASDKENTDPQPQCFPHNHPLSSKDNSPCKKTPPPSPEKRGAALSSHKSPTVRKLQFFEGSDIASDNLDEKQNFAQALSISRQEKLVENENSKSSYLCALLDQESNMLVESSLKDIFEKEVNSSTIKRILDKRLPFTVFNLSLNSWATDRFYHMSFDGKMTASMNQEEKERLKSILKNVEFTFSGIETMKRFIAIKLGEPTIKENCAVSEEDMAFLKKYLEYDDKKPCMHISLMMVNSSRLEMKCIPTQKEKLENLLPDGYIDHKIKKTEHIMRGFRPSEVRTILSKFYLSYLFVISNETRDYISKVPACNKHELYPDIYNQAKTFQKIIPDFPEVARLYFRRNYGLDYDFRGKVSISMKGMAPCPLDQASVNRLFSRIFLLNDEISNQSMEPFFIFQKTTRFYIENTLYKIEERKKEIENGKIVVEDIDSFKFFEVQNQELSEEEQVQYKQKNESDLLMVENLEQELALNLIMSRFFGLSFNTTFFEKFRNEHSDLLNEVINYTPTTRERPLEAILLDLEKVIPEVVKGNFLDQKYEIKKDFCFIDIFNENIIPYIGFFEDIEKDIQEKISSLKIKEIENLKELKGQLYEMIEFSKSQIPNPIFWHKFWHILVEKLPQTLQGKKFSFSKLSTQVFDEEDHENAL